MIATTPASPRKTAQSSAHRREVSSMYSQLPLPPTPPTTPPTGARSHVCDGSTEVSQPPNETASVGYSFPTFPGRPSATTRRSPSMETPPALDFDTLSGEDAATRYVSLTPAQLGENRYSVLSTTSRISADSHRSESARPYAAPTSSANRSLPSRPTLSPRSALVNHQNLDLSFLDSAPPSSSKPATPAPFPRRAVARFPVGRSNAPRGNKDIISRIMSTASMDSNTSLDSLEEETKRVMKSIAVHPARQHQSFSSLPMTTPTTNRMTFPARRIRTTLRNSIDSLTRPSTPPLEHHTSEPATPMYPDPPALAPVTYRPSSRYFNGRRRASLESIGSSFVSNSTTTSMRTNDSDPIIPGLPLHLSASTLQRPWKQGSDSSLSLVDDNESAEDRSRLRNSCSRKNSIGSVTSSEGGGPDEDVESVEKEDRRKTMYYSPDAGWSDEDDEGDVGSGSAAGAEHVGAGLGLDPTVQDLIVLSMQQQLNLLAPSHSPGLSPRNSTFDIISQLSNTIANTSTFPSAFPSRSRNPEAAEQRKRAIQDLMVAEATYAADLRAIYTSSGRGLDLAAIADHCLNSEPPVESSGTGNSSTGRYSGTFNVNTASVLPRQTRRISSTSDKSQTRASTPTRMIPALPKLLLDPVKSANVILEIIETEKSYVRGLVELSELYIIPTAVVITVVDPATGEMREESFIPEDERDVVFGNIETIREFHQDVFLPELITAASSTIDPIGGLARVFTRHSSFLEAYSLYVTTFDSALARIVYWGGGDCRRTSSGSASSARKGALARVSTTELELRPALTRSQSQRIELHMKLCRASPSHSQISLEAYLLLPVQRVPRYRMLLESLIGSTPQIVADGSLRPHKSVQEAYDLICGVATTMNERKRESEGSLEAYASQLKTRGGLGQRFRLAKSVSTIG